MDLSDPPPSARGPHVGAARGPLPVAAGPLLAAVATMALAIGSIALGDAGAATASRPVSAENPFPEVNPCASGVSEVTATIKVCALIQRLEDGEWRTAVFTEPRQAMVWIQLSETGPTAHRKNTVDGVAYVQDNEGIGLTERDDWYVSIQTWNMPPGVRFMTETTPAVYVDVSTGEARTFVFRCESGSCYVPAPTSTPTVTSRPANATRTPSATPSPTEVEATTTVATSPTASGTGTASATATPTGTTDATGTPTATPTPEVTATPGPMGTETTDPVGTPTTEPSATPDPLLTPAEPSGTVTPAAPGSATPSATETAVGPRTPSPYATAPAPPSPSAAPSALPTPSPAITPAARRTAYLPLVIRRPGSTARLR